MYVACRGLGARGSLLVMCVAQIEVHVSLNRVERPKKVVCASWLSAFRVFCLD